MNKHILEWENGSNWNVNMHYMFFGLCSPDACFKYHGKSQTAHVLNVSAQYENKAKQKQKK